MLSTRQKKKLLRRHLIISTSLAVQRENFGYFPRECRACNKQKNVSSRYVVRKTENVQLLYTMCILKP